MQFSALFSYMLWHIELKFCIWLCFTVLQIKFVCHQFASIFVGVMPLLELRILEIHSFPHFSLTPFNILSWKFAYYFVFSVLQIKFECRQLASILELCLFSNLEYCKYSLLHFSLTRFDIMSGNFAYDFVFTVLQIKFECRQFASIFVGVMPLLELRILEIHSFPHFSLTPFNILSWKFAYYFVFSVLQIKFECRQFASILELCLFLNLEYCKYSFLHFSLIRFDILSWNFANDFVLLYYRSTSSVVNLLQFL